LLVIALFGVTGWAQAAEPALPAPQLIVQARPLPALELAGVIDAGGGHGQALMIVDGKERILSPGEPVGNGWRLAEVHRGHVLLADGNKRMKLDLRSRTPYPVAVARAETQATDARAIEIHTPATHAELEPGQTRQFFAMAAQPTDAADETALDVSQPAVLEATDPGMTRSFAGEAAPEVILAEDVPSMDHGGELEAGQAVRFGAQPPPDPATLD
jgi:hypothetical protein